MMATPTGFAELGTATHFSFLEGASSPAEMVETALALGHPGIWCSPMVRPM